MADIITFIPRERSGDLPRDGEPAAVIFFPGVRYERAEALSALDDDPSQQDRRGRRSRRRN
jgi:hypothetical protein